ncbi:hypothetical protein [Streptomyces sp. NRRL S-646]|uniref:hypothetical protein n=1 Tax=Streptomyces sp. NRRL S-646 TaxID=1463917 RepID=UPI000A6E5CB8|nr:hypothetical protein [Streptomyces sp. NRRL S-646]
MAKNKNRERKQPQSERGQQTTQQSSTESHADQHLSQMTPGDMARKGKQKRFGHN